MLAQKYLKLKTGTFTYFTSMLDILFRLIIVINKLAMKENTAISLSTAIKWVNAWRQKADILGEDFIASQIPMTDATAIMAETNAVNIRGYNGYDEATQSYKLILVGIDEKGNDIIPTGNPETTEDSGIYDLTLPCPNTCNVTSPLFAGKI